MSRPRPSCLGCFESAALCRSRREPRARQYRKAPISMLSGRPVRGLVWEWGLHLFWVAFDLPEPLPAPRSQPQTLLKSGLQKDWEQWGRPDGVRHRHRDERLKLVLSIKFSVPGVTEGGQERKLGPKPLLYRSLDRMRESFKCYRKKSKRKIGEGGGSVAVLNWGLG